MAAAERACAGGRGARNHARPSRAGEGRAQQRHQGDDAARVSLPSRCTLPLARERTAARQRTAQSQLRAPAGQPRGQHRQSRARALRSTPPAPGSNVRASQREGGRAFTRHSSSPISESNRRNTAGPAVMKQSSGRTRSEDRAPRRRTTTCDRRGAGLRPSSLPSPAATARSRAATAAFNATTRPRSVAVAIARLSCPCLGVAAVDCRQCSSGRGTRVDAIALRKSSEAKGGGHSKTPERNNGAVRSAQSAPKASSPPPRRTRREALPAGTAAERAPTARPRGASPGAGCRIDADCGYANAREQGLLPAGRTAPRADWSRLRDNSNWIPR